MNEIANKGEGRGPSPVVPKKLGRIAKKLSAAGEELVLIAPAILHSQASEQMLAIARMGMLDKILGYLVTTDKNVHFVRPGIAWDSVRTVPLDVITGVEYVEEFHTNTLKPWWGRGRRRSSFMRTWMASGFISISRELSERTSRQGCELVWTFFSGL